MSSKREYGDYIQDISDAIDAAEQFTQGLSKEEFIEDLKTIYASTRAIEIIGEAAKNIPKPFRDNHPEIPWRDMTGMRNKLTHEYFGIDFSVLWDTTKQDIPHLKVLMSDVFRELSKE
jgi:uncharacterized protein with HEPN domain